MRRSLIKSYAKINMALNVVGKSSSLHKIESIVSFLDLHDNILIKNINKKKHKIKFIGKFSKNIYKNNTVSKLFEILDKKNLLNKKKFEVIINKNIPTKAGLGGGSMNAASILKFFIKKKIVKISNKEIKNITNFVGSDVILGLYSKNLVLKANNEIKEFSKQRCFHTLIVKPNFGCSTREIYSKVKHINKPKFYSPKKYMLKTKFLKKMNNSLEFIALRKYPRLIKIKLFLENLTKVEFVRMTGSGSAIIAYFLSKEMCKKAEKKVSKIFNNCWCKIAKTI